MTDLPQSDTPLPESTAVIPPRRRRADPTPLLILLAVIILGGATYWLLHQPQLMGSARRNTAGQAQLSDLSARVTTLEHTVLPALSGRITELESRPAPATLPVPAPSPAPASPGTASPDSEQIAALSQRVQALETGLADKVAALNAQLDEAHKAAEQVRQIAQQAGRLAQLQRAAAALEMGRPLGTLPDAAPALLRFAVQPPPTEAQLRLQYPAAAAAAHAASRPDMTGKPAWKRMWAEMQRAVTIRQGTHVVVGDPTAGILEAARAQLDAGDLNAAVATLAELNPAAAAAMADWTAKAHALLDARAALADAEQHS